MSSKKYQRSHSKSIQNYQANCELKLYSSPRKKLKIDQNNGSTVHKTHQHIPLIPEHALTVDQMKQDPLQLIEQLQCKYERFGAVKLIAPEQWQPPFTFKLSGLGITSRIQPLHKLRLAKPFEEKKESYSLHSFHQYAHEFERKYKLKLDPQSNKINQLERDYWNFVNGPTQKQLEANPKKYNITVQYAADLPTSKYGSGFPRIQNSKSCDANFDYANSLFNINNIYRSNQSLLKISDKREELISGISQPWLYIGMLFSTFCWHVEDCNINSINYNHQGASKIWYIVPHSHKRQFDDFVLEKYNNRNVLNKITCMIDPLELNKAGIPVYKAQQKPKQYICTFLKAYHCGFSSGFNIGQAVNFIIPSSLSLIRDAQILKQPRKNSLFCYQWLIHENHEHGLTSQVQKEYQQIIKRQEKMLHQISLKYQIVSIQMIQDKVKYDKYSCCLCKKYLYLSFTYCQSCNKYSCLSHANDCCGLDSIILMFRSPNKDRKKILKNCSKVYCKMMVEYN